MAKLLGYDFQIEYKAGVNNRAADALSRSYDEVEFSAVSIPIWLGWRVIRQELRNDAKMMAVVKGLDSGTTTDLVYTLIPILSSRLVLARNSSFIPYLLADVHSTQQGGHSGAYRTYRRLAANMHWQGMMKDVTKFVVECLVCQRQKYDSISCRFVATTSYSGTSLGVHKHGFYYGFTKVRCCGLYLGSS